MGALEQPPRGAAAWGILADAGLKLTLGLVYVLVAPLQNEIAVTTAVAVVSGILVFAMGVVEVRALRTRPLGTFLYVLSTYDTLWILATVIILVVGAGPLLQADAWLGWQGVSALVGCVVLAAGIGARQSFAARHNG